jgi:hypothetical protein
LVGSLVGRACNCPGLKRTTKIAAKRIGARLFIVREELGSCPYQVISYSQYSQRVAAIQTSSSAKGDINLADL